MTDRLVFTVPGRPQPWERVKVIPFRRSKGPKAGKLGIRAFVQDRTSAYKSLVELVGRTAAQRARWTWHQRDTFGVQITVYRADEDHWGGNNQGDWDNFAKAVCDCLNGVLYWDDKAIVDGRVLKRLDPLNPRIEVALWRISDGRLWKKPTRRKKKPDAA